VVAVLAGVVLVGGVAWFVLARSDSSDSATTATLAPVAELVRSTGPDGSYSIGFPGRPDPAESTPLPKNPDQKLMGWSQENAFDPSAAHGYLVISQKFVQRAQPIHQQMAIDAIGEQFGADPSAATIETTVLGHPARRFSFRGDGQANSGIAIATPDYLFLILTVGPAPTEERQAVEDSFQINPAP